MRPTLVLAVLLASPAFSFAGPATPSPLHHPTRQKGPAAVDPAQANAPSAPLSPLHRSTRDKGPGAVSPASHLGHDLDPARPSHPPTREKGPAVKASGA